MVWLKKVKTKWRQYVAEGQARANRYLGDRPHRSFRPTPKHKYKRGKKVAKPWPLVKGTFVAIWEHKKILVSLMLISALALFIFVGGIPTLSFADLRRSTSEVFTGNVGEIGTALSLFGTAITGGLNQATSQLQQFIAGLITFLFWLTYVWVLRRVMADDPEPVTIRDAMYNSAGPLVPTTLIFLTAMVQLIPAAFGSFIAALVLSGAWVQGGVETMVICVAGGLLCLLSLYWVVSTLMALVIVTLPGMHPWRALAGASVLVIGQRWQIAMRMLLLGVVIFLVWLVVLLPILLLDNWLKFDWVPLIPFTVQLLSSFTLLYATVYIYRTYRSML